MYICLHVKGLGQQYDESCGKPQGFVSRRERNKGQQMSKGPMQPFII